VERPVGDESVELGWESLLSDGRVESDFGRDDWVASEEARVVEELVVVVLALSANDKVELEDWVRHIELDVLEVRLVLSILVLDDDRVERSEGELVTLLRVDEHAHNEERGRDVRGSNLGLRGGVENLDVWARNNDEALEVLDTEGDVHVRVQHGGRGNGLSRGAGVEKWDWNIVLGLLLRSVDELVTSIVFANHLEEALTGLSRNLLPNIKVIRGDDVDGLLVQENRNRLRESLSSGIHPVRPQRTSVHVLVANVLRELVRALVNLSKVIVNSRLYRLRLRSSAWIGERLEKRIVLTRARLVALLGNREAATPRSLHGLQTRTRVNDKRLVKIIRNISNLGSQVKSAESNSRVKAERNPLKRKRSKRSETLAPERECCLII